MFASSFPPKHPFLLLPSRENKYSVLNVGRFRRARRYKKPAWHSRGPALCLRGPLAREPSCNPLFYDATVLQTFGTRGGGKKYWSLSMNAAIKVSSANTDCKWWLLLRVPKSILLQLQGGKEFPSLLVLRLLPCQPHHCCGSCSCSSSDCTTVPPLLKLVGACACVFHQLTRWSGGDVSACGSKETRFRFIHLLLTWAAVRF